jgi:hypothetical protein
MAGGSLNAVASRGDDNVLMFVSGVGNTSIVTSVDGDTFVGFTGSHTLYSGGASNDNFLCIRRHPTDNTRFLIVGSRGSNTIDAALLVETQDGTAFTRYPMAPVNAQIRDIVWWPAQNLWVAAQSNGDVQVAPALTGPWTIRSTGNTQRLDKLLVDGPTLYGLGASGRLITTTDAQAFVLSVFDPRITTVNAFEKVGSTFVVTAAVTGAIDGLGRIIVSEDMITARSRIYSDGSLPASPGAFVVADNRIAFTDGQNPVFSQSLDFNPSLQFVAPDLRAGNTVQAEWFIKT